VAFVSNEITDIAKEFFNMLSATGLHINRAVLFGSFSTGSAGKWSDIDIALVSEDFKGIGFYDRKKVNPCMIKTDSMIEPHPFRPEDFTEENPFAKEILKHGIEL